MTALDEIAGERRRDRLDHERNRLMHEFGEGPFRDGQIRDRIKAIDAELARLDRAAQEATDAGAN